MSNEPLHPALRMPLFAQFAARPPRSQRTVVRNAYREAGATYSIVRDFHLQVRRAIQKVHKTGAELSTLDAAAIRVSPQKQPHVRRIVDGYRNWAEGHDLAYFVPPSAVWHSQDGLEVRVSPELGLVIDGQPTLLKLNFTITPTLSAEAATMNALMLHTLAAQVPRGCAAAVLDVRTGLFQFARRLSPLAVEALEAHAADVHRLWDEIEAENAR